MKKFILFFLILVSCKNQNSYELALKEYVKEDLHFKQARIDYKLKIRQIKSNDQPKKYLSLFKEEEFLNRQILKFESRVLETQDTESINIFLKTFKDSISNRDYKHYSYIKTRINSLPFIENDIQKYNLIRKLKVLSYTLNNLELPGNFCDFGINKTFVLATRITDSTVNLNVYSEIAKGYSDNFDNKSLLIDKLEDTDNKKISLVKYNDVIESYLIKTKSDTLYFEATLKTTKEIGLLVAENSSLIVVGESKEFDKNYLKEYFEFYNKN